MPIHKYAKVLVLAPAIGSALIGVFGLLMFGAVLIAGRGEFGSRPVGHAAQHTASIDAVPRPLPVPPPSAPPQGPSSAARNTKSETHLNPSLFQSSIGNGQLQFLKDLSGWAANGAGDKQRVKTLVGLVAPYTPYHFGADFPLPQVIDTLLLNEPQPIEIRDDRYAIISGIRIAIHNRAGLLWVDMREGVALGAIYFDPTNGEPSPTLTIFSRQLNQKSLKMNQLPRAFVEDLNRWAAREAVPSITTRYFIGASGEKYVLPHDGNYCAGAEGMPAVSPKSVCEEMNAQAARIDTTASQFMEQTHNAPNASFKMIASTGPAEQAPMGHLELVGAVRQPQYGIFNDGRIRDSLTGVELTVPKGWIFRGDGPSSGNGQMVRLESNSNIAVNIWMKPVVANPAQVASLLNRAMKDKSSMRGGGWRIRPESVMQRLLTGVPGVSSIADYIQDGRQMVEYDFWMQSGKTHVFFFGVTELPYLPTLQAAVETVASSAQIP